MTYLFDIDGTLLSTGGSGSRAINSVFKTNFGVEGAMDRVIASGKTDPMILTECFHNVLKRAPVGTEIQDVIEAYLPLLGEELASDQRFKLMPHVHACLDFLSAQGLALGIATGNVKLAAEAKLDRAGIRERFVFGGYGCDSGERSQLVRAAIDRAKAHAALHAGNFDQGQVVVVGDTPLDIHAARACKVKVIAVTTGRYKRQELLEHQPDAVMDSLAELIEWHKASALAS